MPYIATCCCSTRVNTHVNVFPCMQTIRALQSIAEMVDWSCDSLQKKKDPFLSFTWELTNIDWFFFTLHFLILRHTQDLTKRGRAQEIELDIEMETRDRSFSDSWDKTFDNSTQDWKMNLKWKDKWESCALCYKGGYRHEESKARKTAPEKLKKKTLHLRRTTSQRGWILMPNFRNRLLKFLSMWKATGWKQSHGWTE